MYNIGIFLPEVIMPAALVECIPNFSEARRPQVVEAIAEALQSVPGVLLLDRHSDPDHNRTVLTFLGEPTQVEEAAFRAIAKAAELIDLNLHQGEHPRIGATDVVPFVPISGIDMAACVEMARRLGDRVGRELGIPVYLYEEAATRPERKNLENIRRGQYEGLKEEIATNPDRAPDFGPARLGPAGATVIGARHPLIAYNVYLNTGDVSIAKKIAKTVRYSSGGLRYVKALGLLVDGMAQVSMNLTNYRQTPLAQVVEMVRREALRYGTTIHHSELVGLIPQDALQDAATWYLQLDGFDPNQVLERRLAGTAGLAAPASAETGGGSRQADFLQSLAAGTPAPGGGSAAAYAGAMGAALAAMLARLTQGKKKYAEVGAQMQAIQEEADALLLELETAVSRDAEAFGAVLSAYRLPRATPEEEQARRQAIEQATRQAAEEPLQVARRAVRVMELACQAARLGNLNAISDAAVGFLLARASLAGAGLNVRVNAKSLQDTGAAEEMLAELEAFQQRASRLEKEVDAALRERAGLGLYLP